MKTLNCTINLFDANQKVYICDNDNILSIQTIATANLLDSLFSICESEGITEIQLIGYQKFSKGLAQKFKAKEITKYGENKINIEVK